MAIIVSLLLAATKDISNRSRWILGGTGVETLISLLLAILALFNLLIGYTVIWMKSNDAESIKKKADH